MSSKTQNVVNPLHYTTTTDYAKALLAGVCIAIGALVNLKAGGIIGAVLFAFGLATIVSMDFNLFTGKAQYITRSNIKGMFLMLLLNIAVCGLISMLMVQPAQDMRDMCNHIVAKRLENIWLTFFGSIGCGFIMTAAVRGVAFKQTYIPLLLGVPTFIICGFPHCIADVVYLVSATNIYITPELALIVWTLVYPLIVIGNLIGCNLYRLGQKNSSLTSFN